MAAHGRSIGGEKLAAAEQSGQYFLHWTALTGALGDKVPRPVGRTEKTSAIWLAAEPFQVAPDGMPPVEKWCCQPFNGWQYWPSDWSSRSRTSSMNFKALPDFATGRFCGRAT